MRTGFLKWLIEKAVPILNTFRKVPDWPYSIEEHRVMDNHSLGKEVANFLDSRKLPLLRKYEVHDVLHVLLGYGTNPLEEMKLQAFMIGNKSATISGKFLFIIGLIIKPEYYPQLRKDLTLGKKASKISKYNFAELQLNNIQDLRKSLQLNWLI